MQEEAPEIDISKSVFFCLGAGGAGRVSAAYLHITELKRYILRAELYQELKLVDDINEKFAPIAEVVDMQDEVAMKEKLQNLT